MGDKFKGRVALITGGSGAIGKAIVNSFAEESCKVFIVGRTPGTLSDSAQTLKEKGHDVTAIRGDISNPADVETIMTEVKKQAGGLDILINAAGFLRVGLVHEITLEDFDLMFSTNVKGLWLISRAAIPLPANRPSANIIHLSSIAGTRTDAGIGVYEATKAAVNTLTKVMAKELAKYRIRVNAIAPGPIDTQLYHGSVFGDDLEDTWTRKKFIANNVPFGRIGTPDEVARLAIFLASPESDFISGSITSIDGGMGY